LELPRTKLGSSKRGRGNFLTLAKLSIEITKKSSHKEFMKLKRLKFGKRKKLTSRC
jgi:hypothetical protein